MDRTVNIGIIGANGVVGSEVCLCLRSIDGVRAIPICRSELSSAFLRQFGFECRHGQVTDEPQATRLLADCDLIVDFSLPRGLPSQSRRVAKALIANAVNLSPRSAPFVYISSTMALGMPSSGGQLKNYKVARTAYGRLKRYSERIALDRAHAIGKKVYVLRLGHVHGEMQPVSRHILRTLRAETAVVPMGQSHTVFAATVAEALAQIAFGREEPGLYTVVSQPAWSWRELHEYYCWRARISSNVVEVDRANGAHRQRFWSSLVSNTARPLVKLALSASLVEVLKSYALWFSPQLERRAMAYFFNYQTHSQLADGKARSRYAPYSAFESFVGPMPGRRLKTLSDSRPWIRERSEGLGNTILRIGKPVVQS